MFASTASAAHLRDRGKRKRQGHLRRPVALLQRGGEEKKGRERLRPVMNVAVALARKKGRASALSPSNKPSGGKRRKKRKNGRTRLPGAPEDVHGKGGGKS